MISRIVLSSIFILASSVVVHAQTPEDSVDSDVLSVEMFATFTSPYVEAYGGYSQWSLENAADIEPGYAIGAILGFQGSRRIVDTDIIRSSANGLYFTYHMAGESKPESYSISSFRFGLSTEDAYAYAFGSDDVAGLYLSASKAPLSWYSVSVDSMPQGLPGSESLMRFTDQLRFGESSTAGLNVRISQPIAITVNYEWAQIYERHLFWFWAGSAVIEGVADGLAGLFVSAVGKSSPAALPIMHFILRNGVAMGFKALRMNQMNWPFTSAAPINIMTYSLGVNITF